MSHRSQGDPRDTLGAAVTRWTAIPRGVRWPLGALVLLTIVSMVWFEVGMNRELTIGPGSEMDVAVSGDGDLGGTSRATLVRGDELWHMRCAIQDDYAWPYCALTISLARPDEGIDLSRYQRVRLRLDVDGPGEPRLRLHLRNYEAAYAGSSEAASGRVNAIEYRPADAGSEVEVPLDAFYVPDWWRLEADVPLADARPRLDAVTRVEILTESVARAGVYDVTFSGMRFSGKWVPRDVLYGGILAAWLAFGLAVLGFATVRAREEARSSRERQLELEMLTDALELERHALLETARRDPLTGALNRLGFRDLIAHHLADVRAGRKRLSAALFDVDRFKHVNDVYGHGVGDDVIVRVANVIQRRTRADDHLVRWGGEEFLVVCVGSERSDAGVLAEKVLAAFRVESWPHGEPLTCSAGYGELAAEPLPDFLRRLDYALYRAKDEGRDRAVAAQPSVSSEDREDDVGLSTSA